MVIIMYCIYLFVYNMRKYKARASRPSMSHMILKHIKWKILFTIQQKPLKDFNIYLEAAFQIRGLKLFYFMPVDRSVYLYRPILALHIIWPCALIIIIIIFKVIW